MHVVTNMHVVVFTSVIVSYFRTHYKVVHGGERKIVEDIRRASAYVARP